MRIASNIGIKTWLTISAFAMVLGGCSSPTSTGEDDFEGTSFVPTDENSGRIEVNVTDREIEVSQTSGFSVRVYDARGNGVPNIKVSCDSEDGIAIIEPNTGTELTDSSGQMSGRIGCTVPGSFQFACRLPIGANKRKFVDMKCTGVVPPGFNGFPGAGGGGLGGGVQVGDDGTPGGTGTDTVRISDIQAFEGTTTETVSIDVVQGTCGTGTDATAEPFFDTSLGVTVVNNTNQIIRFTKLSYSVDNADGAGGQFNSKDLSLVGEAASGVDANGGSGTFTVLVFKANSGRKFFADSTTAIPSNLGFRNVTVRLTGETSLGEEVVVTARTTLSFSNFDLCVS